MQAVVLSALAMLPDLGARAALLLEQGLAGRGWAHQVFDLTEAQIGYCRGCGGCTDRTPGLCAWQDDMCKILPQIVNCQCLVLATPVLFGTHHPVLKRAIDRFLPLAGPVWVIRHGELHHRMRYPRRPALLGVGLLAPGERAEGGTFAHLIRRHAINLDLRSHAALVLPAARLEEAFPATLQAALSQLERRV